MKVEEKAHVRDLTKNQMNSWMLDSSRFTSGIILRVCIDTLWLQRTNRLSKEDISNPINLLKLGLQCISPATIVDKLVRNKDGPQEASFHVALYSAFNGMLPTTMLCLFETKAEGRTQLDLMVTDGGANWTGYELKTNLTSPADFKKHFEQVSNYVQHYKIPIHLVNFYLEGRSTPAKLKDIPAGIIVVNIMHNMECTNFVISEPDGTKSTINTNNQNLLQ